MVSHLSLLSIKNQPVPLSVVRHEIEAKPGSIQCPQACGALREVNL